jgi:catechol 2,3-dioxygenase-like lactoylglutathione lyase family enzyme
MNDRGFVFDQFNLVVSDMDASVAFYRRLGLRIPDGTPEWRDHHRSVDLPGGVQLDFDSVAFARQWNRGWRSTPGAAMGVLGFRVATRQAVDTLHADLVAAGYASQQAPYDAFWGARYAVVSDPDGHAVGLMSPADPSRRSGTTPP